MSEEKSRYDVKLRMFGIPRLLPFLSKHKKMFAWMLITSVVASMIDSIYPLFNQYALDHFIGQRVLKGIAAFTVAYILMIVLQCLLNFASTYLCGKIEMTIDRDLRKCFFQSFAGTVIFLFQSE